MSGPYVVAVSRGGDVISRRAVADRGELELTISRLLDGTDSPATRFRARQVVGDDRPGEIPLPDGTVIRVERVPVIVLLRRIPRVEDRPKRTLGRKSKPRDQWLTEVIDAYNQRRRRRRAPNPYPVP